MKLSVGGWPLVTANTGCRWTGCLTLRRTALVALGRVRGRDSAGWLLNDPFARDCCLGVVSDMPGNGHIGLGVQDSLKPPGAEFEHFLVPRSVLVVVGVRRMGPLHLGSGGAPHEVDERSGHFFSSGASG